jgi:hypothetical protein
MVCLKYYKLSQCKDTSNVLQIPQIDKEALNCGYGLVKQIKENENSVFLNFYENPFPIVSDQLRKTIQLHELDAIGQPLALANMETKFLLVYWILNLSTVCCKNGNSIILNKEDIKNKNIFKVKLGTIDYVIINFDLAEEILRALNVDIELEEVEVNG